MKFAKPGSYYTSYKNNYTHIIFALLDKRMTRNQCFGTFVHEFHLVLLQISLLWCTSSGRYRVQDTLFQQR